MTDIVERLRLLNELFLGDEPSQTAPFCNGTAQEIIDLAQEAADEILLLRNKVETLLAYTRHERDLGAEQVIVACADEILGLRAAVEDAQKLIDNDLVGPWIAAHKLDWMMK